jgi:2-polyprenyl-3-methyl-5-hydroxy-6-metoxy-1,4-benzoquinol methylase
MGTSDTKHQRIAQYPTTYASDYGFERMMVAARRRLLLNVLASSDHDVIVEVGCGSDLLVDSAAAAGLTWRRWIVVEPAERFAALADQAATRHRGVTVVNDFVEDAVERIASAAEHGADLVLCSSVLHEVDDERVVLEALRQLLSTNGRVHVNVPNADSFHRRLARVMGLVADEHELTARNRALNQQRMFDLASLADLMESAGFLVEATGGYFLKPFTHAQMETLEFVTDDILEGLYTLGSELPDLAAEIYVNASAGR